jgi:hypothetical protein
MQLSRTAIVVGACAVSIFAARASAASNVPPTKSNDTSQVEAGALCTGWLSLFPDTCRALMEVAAAPRDASTGMPSGKRQH